MYRALPAPSTGFMSLPISCSTRPTEIRKYLPQENRALRQLTVSKPAVSLVHMLAYKVTRAYTVTKTETINQL